MNHLIPSGIPRTNPTTHTIVPPAEISHQIFKPITSNCFLIDNAAARGHPTNGSIPDYGNLLANGGECSGTIDDSPGSHFPCVLTRYGLLIQINSDEHQLFNGRCTIRSKELYITGQFKQGEPEGPLRVAIYSGKDVHNYLCMMTITETQCNLVCLTRGIDGRPEVGKNRLLNEKKLNDTGSAYEVFVVTASSAIVLTDSGWIEGAIKDGKPDGTMTCVTFSETDTVTYKGEMGINKNLWRANGDGVTETRNNLVAWQPEQDGAVVAGSNGLFLYGDLIDGVDIDRQNDRLVKTDIVEKGIVIKESILDLTTNKLQIVELGSGDIYEGENNTKNNKPNGRGAMRYGNGNECEGTFKEGQLHGEECTFTWKNGNEYQGQFKEGVLTGRGIIRWLSDDKSDDKNGHWYDGDFNRGQRTGQGTYFFSEQEKVSGIWNQGQLITRQFAEGLTFTGEFGERLAPEKGIWTWSDGTTCQCEWNGCDQQFAGKAELIVPKVSKYNGDVVLINGKFVPQGEGTRQGWHGSGWSRKNQQTGAWENGVFQPVTISTQKKSIQNTNATPQKEAPALSKPGSTIAFPKTRGVSYEGETKVTADGKSVKHGNGVLTRNGVIYQGNFVDDQPQGVFAVTYLNKDVYKGEIAPDTYQRQGTGSLTLPDRTVCQGEWENNEPTKKMTTCFSNNSIFVGEIKIEKEVTTNKKQKQEAPGTRILENGQGTMTLFTGEVVQGQWTDGEFDHGSTTSERAGGVSITGPVNKQFQFDGPVIMSLPNENQVTVNAINGELNLRNVTVGFKDQSKLIRYIGALDEQLKPIGRATWIMANGNKVSGESIKGSIYFNAVHVEFPDESVYDGAIDQQGQPHGFGVLRKGNETITGEWTHGVLDEQGQ